METEEKYNDSPEMDQTQVTGEDIPASLPEETIPSDLGETGTNLEICPNCLEPNTDGLAVCRYCGMPLHQGAEPDLQAIEETEAEMAANRAAAAPEPPKPAKKQESGFRRIMPYLGLYLIYYAITGCFDISRQIKQAAEEGQAVNAPLAYLSQGIWFAAGLMMAWPLIKKGYRKLRHLPEEDETPAEAPAAEEETAAEEVIPEQDEPGADEEADSAEPQDETDQEEAE